MSAMKIGINFGALAEPIAKQLRAQGIRLRAGQARNGIVGQSQRDADAITRLNVRGILSDGEARKARQRVLKHLVSSLEGVR